MNVTVNQYIAEDIKKVINVWNQVVEDGEAFPQMELLTEESGKEFFAKQDYVGVAKCENEVVGLYILHPNNVGRCGHQANASYAVSRTCRGKKIGEKLVRHSMEQAKQLGYRLLIFNAVVKGNDRAIHLYNKLGFHKIGEVPNGFMRKNGEYRDINLFYHEL